MAFGLAIGGHLTFDGEFNAVRSGRQGGKFDQGAIVRGHDERKAALFVFVEIAHLHVGVGGVEDEEPAERGVLDDGGGFQARGKFDGDDGVVELHGRRAIRN